MTPAEPLSKQFILAGDHQIELPTGVTVAEWALERVSVQNPRIRSYLGCIRLLEQTLESNYAILHCSEGRLLDIWRKVRKVCRLIQAELAPTLDEASNIPELETARSNTQLAYLSLSNTVIQDIEAYPFSIPDNDLPAVRRLLCLSIGRIYSFLRDTFGEIVASDPRSLHDSDYYLSRRFPQEIDEAEWLYTTVDRMNRQLQGLSSAWKEEYGPLRERLEREKTVPAAIVWGEVAATVGLLADGLVNNVREVLSLSGIRFNEMEPLDRHAYDIPHNCQSLLDTYDLAQATIGRLKGNAGRSIEQRQQSVDDLLRCHAAFSSRLVELMGRIDRALRDLVAQVPLWLDSIESRRALMLTKNPAEIPELPARGSRGHATR